MTGTKQRTVYRKMRKWTFGGVPTQSTASNDTDTIVESFPAKKSGSVK